MMCEFFFLSANFVRSRRERYTRSVSSSMKIPSAVLRFYPQTNRQVTKRIFAFSLIFFRNAPLILKAVTACVLLFRVQKDGKCWEIWNERRKQDDRGCERRGREEMNRGSGEGKEAKNYYGNLLLTWVLSLCFYVFSVQLKLLQSTERTSLCL
jgi:hypothetical protein